MVVIQFAGGLGNQMFQYALSLQLQSLGRKVKIDDVSGFTQDARREPALAPFGIAYERPAKKELQAMLDSSMLPWQRVRRRLFGRHKRSYFEESKLFIPEVFTWDDIYLEGYWQSERYFQGSEERVRAAYDTDRLIAYLQDAGLWSGSVLLREDGNEAGGDDQPYKDGNEAEKKSAAQYLDEINNTCSVSVHVRRGDYLSPKNQALFGGICTEVYYKEGMRRMRQYYPDCRFYLFCNDKEWARDFAGIQGDIVLIDLPHAGDAPMDGDYAEFVLMSRCKHHILANSSFSWWASYLNQNPDKTVLAPERWLNGKDCRDCYRADMQKIVL